MLASGVVIVAAPAFKFLKADAALTLDATHAGGSWLASLRMDDPRWSAEEVIQVYESLRSQLSVPFWMYDGVVGGVNFTSAIDAVFACAHESGSIASRYATNSHFGGDVAFIAQLREHHWRVTRSEEASIIIIPLLTACDPRLDFQHRCSGNKPAGRTPCSRMG